MASKIPELNQARLFPKYCYTKWLCFQLTLVLLLSRHADSFTTVEFLPGFPGPLPFKLETGYVGVDEREDVQLFYYFIESEGNAREDPLLLWLSGGPGCSALSGLIFQIGPIGFRMEEYNGTLPTLVLRQYSWTKHASIIFLDAPVGTGFSYSRRLQSMKSGDFIAAKQNHIFLKKWLLSHPQFIMNPIYIGGDSYAGKTVPLLVKEISDGIVAGHKPSINLKGYLVGNPGTDPQFDMNSRIPFAHRMGFVSDELYKSARKNCKGKYLNVDSNNIRCKKDIQSIDEGIKHINQAHVLEPDCDSKFWAANKIDVKRRVLQDVYEGSIRPAFGCRSYNGFICTVWANDQKVQRALGVRQGTVNEWIRCNRSLPYTKDCSSAVIYHQHLSTKSYQVLVYSGDHDMMVPYLGTQSWIKTLNLSIVKDWRPWLIDGQVGGYCREYANRFTFATVKGAGHTAAEYRPKECFAMFKRWLSHQPL